MSAASPLRVLLDAQTTERDFQQAIVHLAKLRGFRLYHTFRSDRSPAGFPDLVLCKPPRLIFAELKRERGKTTADQEAWLADLRAAGVEAYLWRPSDWDSVVEVLTHSDNEGAN